MHGRVSEHGARPHDTRTCHGLDTADVPRPDVGSARAPSAEELRHAFDSAHVPPADMAIGLRCGCVVGAPLADCCKQLASRIEDVLAAGGWQDE